MSKNLTGCVLILSFFVVSIGISDSDEPTNSAPTPDPTAVTAVRLKDGPPPILIDFGTTPDATGGFNAVALTGGYGTVVSVANLLDAAGAQTGIGLRAFCGPKTSAPADFPADTGFGASTAYTGQENGVTGAALTAFGQNNAAGNAFVASDEMSNGTIYFTGLDPMKKYNFTILGAIAKSSNLSTIYTATGSNSVTATLNAANNNSNVAVLSGIVPTNDGKISLALTPDPTNNDPGHLTVINAIRIDVISL